MEAYEEERGVKVKERKNGSREKEIEHGVYLTEGGNMDRCYLIACSECTAWYMEHLGLGADRRRARTGVTIWITRHATGSN